MTRARKQLSSFEQMKKRVAKRQRARTTDAWAVRCWYWKEGADREGDHDLLDVQEEQWRRCPKSMIHAIGKKLAAHPHATSPGLYDVMRGTPDQHSMDGYDWQPFEEVRP